jgi:hypothetical protein
LFACAAPALLRGCPAVAGCLHATRVLPLRRWRYIARIAALEPDFDDTINIEGALHRVSNVAFTLANPFMQYAPFKVRGAARWARYDRLFVPGCRSPLLPFPPCALCVHLRCRFCRPDAMPVCCRWLRAGLSAVPQASFSLGSGPEFTVFPTEGVLPPQGSPPTQFVVSFTPHEYGKACVAKLFVEVRG